MSGSGRTRVGGLPSNPRARAGPGGRQTPTPTSRSYTSSTYDDEPRSTRSAPRSEHSYNDHSRSRRGYEDDSRSRRGHEDDDSRRPTNTRSYDRPSGRRSEESYTSSSSGSSGSSSLFDRMKNGAAGYLSSTTVEDEEEEEDYRKATSRRGRGSHDRHEEEDVPEPATNGYGTTIWGSVATAASSLTISVSKAWATNVTLQAGEETPPGKESRLTRAMKAYHLEKARDPTDLPSWLFDERERQPKRREKERPTPSPREREREREREEPTSRRPARGLRDVYDAVSSKNQAPVGITQSETNTNRVGAAAPAPAPARGADRLRAMREGKRGAVGSMVQSEPERSSPPPRARVGLPGGPARSRRV